MERRCTFLGFTPAMSKARRAETAMADVVRLGAYVMLRWVQYSPAPRMETAGFGAERATLADVTTTAAAPAQGMTISSMCNGSRMIGELRTSSTVMGWP